MHPEHARLLGEMTGAARPPSRMPEGYLGQGSHPVLGLSVPARREIARAWAAAAPPDLPASELLALVDSLYAGETFEERTLGPLLLAQRRAWREAVSPRDVERWLGGLVGWAEVDHLCQNLFQADQMLADWAGWHASLVRMRGDPVIARRRASLVLLVGPVSRSADPRLADLAFANIAALQGERDVLITKAVSWLMRSLVRRHGAAVAAYLDAHAAALPAIAVRETRAKLATGRKGPAPTA